VTAAVSDGIAHVQMNRPEKLNALDIPMFEGLLAAGLRVADDDSVRAVVLSGRGRAFCAGLDFAQFADISADSGSGSDVLVIDDDRVGSARALGQKAVRVWSVVPVPVIAALHGVAYGGGLQIALGADLRFSTSDADLSVMEVRWGLVPDMAGTQLLPDLVGRDVAKDLTFTGRTLTGAEACSLGLVTRIVEDPLSEALEFARQIAQFEPRAVRHAKRLIDLAGRVPLADGLDAEQEAIADLVTDPGVQQFMRTRLVQMDGPHKARTDK
jgi:enoyl-CoA hydratase/carnithine racemase